jgi:hypothetical protein
VVPDIDNGVLLEPDALIGEVGTGLRDARSAASVRPACAESGGGILDAPRALHWID